MKKFFVFSVIALVCVSCFAGEPFSLFNGTDLSGWHIDVPHLDKNPDAESPFIVRDGMLVSLGKPGGHVITDAEYSDYRLEVEYRFAAKPGNCGVLVHASTPRSLYKMFPKSVEVQMMHKNAGDFWCIVEDITVPDMVARRGPKEKWGIVEGKSRRIKNLTDDSEKPAGEWNRMVIECLGDSVKVWVNGDVVNHGTGCTASSGQIALQAEGSEVEFRKLLLTPLKKSGASKFEPTWESLKQYETPLWNMDGKFGIFIHWGVYAVPAAGSEWYPRNMYNKGNKLFEYHKKTWGDQSKFGYKDFVPMFKAEKWDPEKWAELFKKSGATYVVPVAEHHDGFAMYDSSHTQWNSVDMGPKRDICGELSKAVRKRGMKFGVSTHYAWNWRYYFKDESFDNVNPGYADLYGVNHAPDAKASDAFIEHWYGRTKELIDNYQPDLIWFDFGFCHPEFEQGRKEIAAYYYNKGIEWDKGVALNYKRWTKPSVGVNEVAFPAGAGTLDLEREKSPNIREFFWQTDTSISTKSWGYIDNDTFKSPDRLIDDLVDIVSKNGCLLLNVGPRADGTIPQGAQDILLAMGEWLDKNGAAIYKTRPWKISGEGPTGTAQGHLSENKNKAFTAEDIRYTQDGKHLYVIALDWPKNGKLVIKTLGSDMKVGAKGIASVSMLSNGEKLKWSRDAAGLSITLPRPKPGDFAYVFKITPKGGLVTE